MAKPSWHIKLTITITNLYWTHFECHLFLNIISFKSLINSINLVSPFHSWGSLRDEVGQLPAQGHAGGSDGAGAHVFISVLTWKWQVGWELLGGSSEGTSEWRYEELSVQIVCSLTEIVTCFHKSDWNRDLWLWGMESRAKPRKVIWKCYWQTKEHKLDSCILDSVFSVWGWGRCFL